MNILSRAIASYKRSDFAGALTLFEQAGELYGRHVVDVNILMCRKAQAQQHGFATLAPSISSEQAPSPRFDLQEAKSKVEVNVSSLAVDASLKDVDLAKADKDAIAEQAEIVRASLFHSNNSKRLNEAIRYPTSPDAEGIVDLMLSLPSLSHSKGVRRIQDAFKLGRYALVERWLKEALVEKPDDIKLRMVAAKLDYGLGNYEKAVDKLERLLADSNGDKEALQLLAHAYTHHGQFLEAMATLTEGRGLTEWLNSVPTLDQAKLAARMDWMGVVLAAGGVNQNFVSVFERACSVTGPPARLVDAAYSLIFLGDVNQFPGVDVADLFLNLSQRTACSQIAYVDFALVISEIECVGPWAFVFTDLVDVNAVLLEAIFAQKRSNEPVVKILKCRMNVSGVPASFHLVGVLASAESLRAFGRVTFVEWVKAAERSLRVKTVLI